MATEITTEAEAEEDLEVAEVDLKGVTRVSTNSAM